MIVAENPFIEKITRFYFQASLSGFVNNGVYSTDLENPARYTFRKTIDEFTLEDVFTTHEGSRYAAGQTTIFLDKTPVWVMQYGGHYLQAAIPCLQAALRGAYVKNLFIGGRGLELMIFGAYYYVNRAVGDFTEFKGREEIFDIVNVQSAGYHTYQGWMLHTF